MERVKKPGEARFSAGAAPYTEWFKAQDFPFSQDTAQRLKAAAANEAEVRAFISSRSTSSAKGRDISVATALEYMNRKSLPEPTPRAESEASDDAGYTKVRAGIYDLLGIEFDEDIQPVITKNGLLQLPDDQLAELKTLVEFLAAAYKEAVVARRTA
jgi:hypothetical protein